MSPDEVIEPDLVVTLTATFYIKDLEGLQALARRLDDQEHGVHQKYYTPTQALVVALHNEPRSLFKHLEGWCESGGENQKLWGNIEWEDASD